MDIIRRDTARKYRSIRKILRGSEPEVFDHPPEMSLTKKILFTLGITGLVILGSCSLVHAATLDQWADAIRITEGNPNYGILSVKTHNPRQVCKNTVRHAFKRFVARGGNPSDLKGFIIALGNQYCPYSVDPIGNINWKHNMEALLL